RIIRTGKALIQRSASEQAREYALSAISSRTPEGIEFGVSCLLTIGQLNDAIGVLGRIGNEGTSTAIYWRDAGLVALRTGKIADACSAFLHASALAPGNPENELALGFALLAAGSPAAAAEALK